MTQEQVERRLAAILSADVVGYSRMTGADEEGTISRLAAVRAELIEPAIQTHRGRTVKTIGDGFLIEFPSVVDGLRAFLEVQRGMAEHNSALDLDKRIEFRVGLHVGDVIVQADGDLLGDSVNIAARLESIAEPGTIFISEDAYRHVRDRVPEQFIDLGEKYLKNIARPVRVYSVGTAVEASSPSVQSHQSEKRDARRLSIVVLPFANLADAEHEHFVDGVTESLTTDLSRISGATVIARNTAFTYKGKAIDVKQIGRELNIRYVLEGSVQRGGDRLRINVQLIDAETATHVWAERFDKPLTDLLDLQDEIVARVARSLNAQLIAAEARRAEATPNPDAMDLCFQGMAWANKGLTPEYMAQAQDFFERALALDPNNLDALVGTAAVDTFCGANFMTDKRVSRLAAAEANLTRILSVAPDHAWAHCLLGAVRVATNRATQGIAECERSLELDKNLAAAHGIIGLAKYLTGEAEQTESHVQEALRLSPSDTYVYFWSAFAGIAKMQLGRLEEAIVWLRRGIENNPNLPAAHFCLASAQAQLGIIDQAQDAVKAGLALDPSFTIRRFRNGAASDNHLYLAQRERIIEGMRAAGVPEG